MSTAALAVLRRTAPSLLSGLPGCAGGVSAALCSHQDASAYCSCSTSGRGGSCPRCLSAATPWGLPTGRSFSSGPDSGSPQQDATPGQAPASATDAGAESATKGEEEEESYELRLKRIASLLGKLKHNVDLRMEPSVAETEGLMAELEKRRQHIWHLTMTRHRLDMERTLLQRYPGMPPIEVLRERVRRRREGLPV